MSNFLIHCSNCDEKDDIYQCKGCLKIYCIQHFTNHRQSIQENFNELKDNFDFLRENCQNFQKHFPLIEQINQWEIESINKIKQIANQCKEDIFNYTKIIQRQFEKNFNILYEKSKEILKENKLNEILLSEINEKLNKLIQEFNRPINISIQQYSTSFINQIYVMKPIVKEKKWKQNRILVAGENESNLLSYPNGICINDHQTIYIADCWNDRIVEWKLNSHKSRIVAGGNGNGKQTNQLNRPTDVLLNKENNSLIIADRENRRVMRWSLENNTTHGQIIIDDIDCFGLAMGKDESLYVSDFEKNEVIQWKIGEVNGRVIAGGNNQGNELNQLNTPTYIFVDEDYSLYISDFNNHRVMKWMKDAKEGIIVAGGNGQGNSLKQLYNPQGVIVNELGQIYISDFRNHRVMCWNKEDVQGRIIIDGNSEENQLNYPRGLSFDFEGNLYVVDEGNNRILKFESDSN